MKVKIKDYEWEILRVEEKHEGLKCDKDDDYNHGVCHLTEQKIYIADNLTKERFLFVLKHELVHAFWCSYGFNCVSGSEEIMCDFFGTYAEDILKIVNDYFKKEEMK